MCHLLLGVIVAREPPGFMVACHRKLRALLFNEEIVKLWLLWELIAETDTVVINTEANQNGALCGRLLERGF